jgi:hypothetical protein
MALGVKSRNLACVSNMTKIMSLTTMHAAASSVNCGFLRKTERTEEGNRPREIGDRKIDEYLLAHGSFPCADGCVDIRCNPSAGVKRRRSPRTGIVAEGR